MTIIYEMQDALVVQAQNVYFTVSILIQFVTSAGLGSSVPLKLRYFRFKIGTFSLSL